MEQYTTTVSSSNSWSSRLKNSFKGIVLGSVCFVAGTVLLVSKEWHSIQSHRALQEGLQSVVELNNISSIDPTHEGKLVHASGTVVGNINITDGTFGVPAPPGALKLKRSVQILQWAESVTQEHEKTRGGGDTIRRHYSYYQGWFGSPINSAEFQDPYDHMNPTIPAVFHSALLQTQSATFGAFSIPDSIVDRFTWYAPLDESRLLVENIPSSTINLIERMEVWQIPGQSTFYFGVSKDSISAPQVGDVQIRFDVISAQTISIIACQKSNSLKKYVAGNNHTILMVESGIVSAREMFIHAQKTVTARAWLFRLGGFTLIWASLMMVLAPLSVFADVIPVLGDLVEGVSGFVAGIASLVISTTITFLAWLAFHPVILLIVLLFVGVSAGGFYCYKLQQDTGILASSTDTIHYSLLDVDAVTEVHPN